LNVGRGSAVRGTEWDVCRVAARTLAVCDAPWDSAGSPSRTLGESRRHARLAVDAEGHARVSLRRRTGARGPTERDGALRLAASADRAAPRGYHGGTAWLRQLQRAGVAGRSSSLRGTSATSSGDEPRTGRGALYCNCSGIGLSLWWARPLAPALWKSSPSIGKRASQLNRERRGGSDALWQYGTGPR
jgi:hypothetical protein